MMFNQPNFYDQATHNVAHQTVNKQVHKPTFITQFTQNIDSLGTGAPLHKYVPWWSHG